MRIAWDQFQKGLTMDFLSLVKSRQFLAQLAHPEEFAEHISTGKRLAYVGFDPTAESLHVGNLMAIMALKRWQQAGHKAVVLMGGATAMIGDPTGKSELRQVLTEDVIDSRIQKLQKQFGIFLNTDPDCFALVNNGDWFRKMQYLPLLREIGTDFTVNRMLAAECFKQRYEKGLSFLEFNYMILQSYDFLHLNRTMDVTVQLGGDDQWSNMIGGMDLIRRKERKQAFIATNPLLTTTSGLKMGKTEKGAVWLDPELTPPFELFQYFRNIEDDMVKKCLYYFTDLPENEVEHLGSLKDQAINDAKIVLAFELTKLIHGNSEASAARDKAQSLFKQGSSDDAPVVEIDGSPFNGTTASLVDLLIAAKIFDSKSDARRNIEQGGVSIDETKITDIKATVPLETLSNKGLIVRKGKKHIYRVKFL
jgi:tyrosyl-tRNA synthetase